MTDVVSIVDGLDLVVSLADGHLHPDDLGSARRSALEARSRVGYLGSTLVAALLGGTGAGKSSLLNALAGEEITSTSPVRPHTEQPLAWVPARAEPGLFRLLDAFGVSRRITQEKLPGIALLDMTDIDSVEVAHRTTVEAVLPAVDIGLWVLDPLKYAEGSLHHDFVRPLASAANRMVFVLNQVDRIPGDERGAIRDHLMELLRRDGIEQPIVFETAADPPLGPRVGIDALLHLLADLLDEKRIHLGRVVEDARVTARRVASATGVGSGGSVDFEERWDRVRRRAVAELSVTGSEVGGLEEALRSIEHFVGSISARAGALSGCGSARSSISIASRRACGPRSR